MSVGIITQGIGSGSSIKYFLTLGLDIDEIELVALTLGARSAGATLDDRSSAATLASRSRAATLVARSVGGTLDSRDASLTVPTR